MYRMEDEKVRKRVLDHLNRIKRDAEIMKMYFGLHPYVKPHSYAKISRVTKLCHSYPRAIVFKMYRQLLRSRVIGRHQGLKR